MDIKIRVDGLLQPYATLPQKEWEPFHNRLKIMANLDIAESRRPQSGHVELVISDILSIFVFQHTPPFMGENIVIRFLDKHKGVLSLQELGFVDFQIKILKDIIAL